jgi:hypothetical protein
MNDSAVSPEFAVADRPQTHNATIVRLAMARLDGGRKSMFIPHEIKTGVLHQPHVAEKSAVGHRIAPAGVVLLHVGALETRMPALVKRILVAGEFGPQP